MNRLELPISVSRLVGVSERREKFAKSLLTIINLFFRFRRTFFPKSKSPPVEGNDNSAFPAPLLDFPSRFGKTGIGKRRPGRKKDK